MELSKRIGYAQVRRRDSAEIDSNRSSSSFEMLNETSVDNGDPSPISLAARREEYKKRLVTRYAKGVHSEMNHKPNTDNVSSSAKKNKPYVKADRPNIPRGDSRKYLEQELKAVEVEVTKERFGIKEPVKEPQPPIENAPEEISTNENTQPEPQLDSSSQSNTKEDEKVSESPISAVESKEILQEPLLIEDIISTEEIKTHFVDLLRDPSSSAGVLKAVVTR
eukprot:TRINITY_DN9728_c0_g1_i22.p1 TRINITY_DN9728_c0_g1~~TRINITY_DN9728_c0_g1_i22.p1  ORF type:complete len:222 (-),score=53.24 TRINITY_DN9728_c0_g1_i22:929-1594(-)